MQVRCPNCSCENKVAGYRYRPARSIDGKNDRSVICGFCGKKFVPEYVGQTDSNSRESSE